MRVLTGLLRGRSSQRRGETDPARVGVVGLVVVVLAVTAALNIGEIQRALGGATYHAEFTHASGLRAGDPVHVSGMKVGKVEEVRIDGTQVRVTFHADGIELGDRTRAAIKTASAVGNRFLAVAPAGSGSTDRVPLSRTSVPYDLTSALGDITRETADLDVTRLAEAMNAVAQNLDQTPDSFRSAISGVHKLATVVAERDDALRDLLQDAAGVSSVLADRSETIVSLMSQGNLVLTELAARRETIRTLLAATHEISVQISGLVRDNQEQLRPALDQLNQTVTVLRRNEKSLNFLIDHLGGYARNLGEAVGGGPFFYGFVQNIVPTNLRPGADRAPAGDR